MITSITKEDQLISAQGINSPILYSQYWYSKHSNLNFGVDLQHYLFEGQVLSTPNAFVMGKLIFIKEEVVFFVRFAYGKLEELKQHLPTDVQEIAFCRNNQGNVRKYSIDRLKELSTLATPSSPIFSMNNVLEGGRFRSAA